jgi:RES domain-containing protein
LTRRAWRVVKSARSADAFDGEGARLHGGRWNSPGISLVYTAQSESLAALELLVHLQNSRVLQQSYCTIPVEFEDAHVELLDPKTLPGDWRKHPAPNTLQALGDRWAKEQRTAVLQVPNAVIPRESNYLLNPHHPDFASIRISPPESFEFDARLRAPQHP